MNCEKELTLLCDTLKRCRVPACVVSLSDPISRVVDLHIRKLIWNGFKNEDTVLSYVGNLSAHTMYKYTDEFKLCYIYLKLSELTDSPVLFVGPYMSEMLSSRGLLELGESLGIPPSTQRYFERFYQSITVLSEKDPVFVMLDTFCEHIWNNPSFAICNVNSLENIILSPIRENSPNDSFDDALLNIKTMEIRYKFENELMEAITLGQLHKEKLLMSSFSDKMFEKRVSDPLRNSKNYCIIMNTLLRKAAEKGGVHPVHIDKMSSGYALKIEQVSLTTDIPSLMREMFRSYCKLVRKHAIRHYSLLIQKSVLLIESDLSTDLSLSALAKQQGVSGGYLATVFKKETGKTVSEYVRDKRIEHAKYLLSTTHLQIQTVALHCGIMDVQYFSKIFKKQIGKTPREYRDAIRAFA